MISAMAPVLLFRVKPQRYEGASSCPLHFSPLQRCRGLFDAVAFRILSVVYGSFHQQRSHQFCSMKRNGRKREVEGGKKKASGTQSLVSDNSHGVTVTSKGAMGTPVFTGTSTIGSGESVNETA